MALMGLVTTGRRDDGAPGVGTAVAAFAGAGIVAMLIVGVLGFGLLRHAGREEALRDAERLTSTLTRGVIEPALGEDVVDGDPAAVKAFDEIITKRVLDEDIRRVKIWDAAGKVIYSDESRLNGVTFGLRDGERGSLLTGSPDVGVADLSSPENAYEPRNESLVEVYLPITGPAGQTLLMETYIREGAVQQSGSRLLRSFAPALAVALLGLWLLQLPLAWSLARRLRRRQAERERLLRHAVESSERERRRIAADLHDGVVQDLAGSAFALSAQARRHADDPETAALLITAADETRRCVRQLRTLLVDIYPPSLHDAGLAAALGDLVEPLERQGIAADLHLVDELDLPPTAEAALFRAAQEAVRNAVEHASAERVRVRAGRRGDVAYVEVVDDGRGFDTEHAMREGHFGLRLLRDLVADAGGTLDIVSSPGNGTRVQIEVPA